MLVKWIDGAEKARGEQTLACHSDLLNVKNLFQRQTFYFIAFQNCL